MKRNLIIWMTLCCFANILSVNNLILSVLLCIIEHAFFFCLFFQKKFFYAFLSFILFSSAALEVHSFVLQSESSTLYSFFYVPVLYGILATFDILLLCIAILPLVKAAIRNNKYASLFVKWMIWFLVVGGVISVITFILDDNGIRSSGLYPKVTILELLSYLYRFAVITIAIVYIYHFDKERQLGVFCQFLLISLVFSGLMGGLLGLEGYYGDDITMLSSLAVGFTPCLFLFTDKNEHRLLSLISAIIIVLACFIYPSVIGSKWYLVVGVSILCAVYRYLGFKTARPLVYIAVASLFAVPLIMNFVSSKVDSSSYVSYKLTQALRTINIFGAGSVEDWSEDMGQSPLFRFDELHNTLIEYTEKPVYALTGKGFGGTTRHHTSLLSWETKAGAFSKEEVSMGAYYEMHESLAQIFLRHGFPGVFFLFLFLFLFFKSIPDSPWALCALLWLFFYWDYGSSFTIGMVSVVFVLKSLDRRKCNVGNINQ